MDATQTPEEWRPVVGHEGLYEVSSLGRVRSVAATKVDVTGRVKSYPSRVLKPWYARAYLYLSLGSRTKKAVHLLVAEAFLGPRPEPTHQARHLNGVADDNRAENLRWGTASENQLDRREHHTAHNHNTFKAVCKNGHAFTADNTYWRTTGERSCRKCARESAKRYQRRLADVRMRPVRGSVGDLDGNTTQPSTEGEGA